VRWWLQLAESEQARAAADDKAAAALAQCENYKALVAVLKGDLQKGSDQVHHIPRAVD